VQSFRHGPLAPLDALRSLSPDEAAAATSAAMVFGSGAEALVSARGFGMATDALPRAADARRLPAELRNLPPRPVYGRDPDAKPSA
jgi:tRNA threonylcarbamoyladenosine biosynthesis protein TsaB